MTWAMASDLTVPDMLIIPVRVEWSHPKVSTPSPRYVSGCSLIREFHNVRG